MEVYEKSTAPLADFYCRLGLLVPVAAQPFAEATLARTLAALHSRDAN
jgi:adenylate kinase family enzyme